jgi:transcriptional regulator with XRE-family HTH domain
VTRNQGHAFSACSERNKGISQSAIARLENGHTLPGIKTLLRFAEATSSKLQVRLSAA